MDIFLFSFKKKMFSSEVQTIPIYINQFKIFDGFIITKFRVQSRAKKTNINVAVNKN